MRVITVGYKLNTPAEKGEVRLRKMAVLREFKREARRNSSAPLLTEPRTILFVSYLKRNPQAMEGEEKTSSEMAS